MHLGLNVSSSTHDCGCTVDGGNTMAAIPYLWVGLNLKMAVTQMTLHPKLVNGGGVVVAHFGLLCIVADSHTNVRSTAITPYVVW